MSESSPAKLPITVTALLRNRTARETLNTKILNPKPKPLKPYNKTDPKPLNL